MNSQLIVGNLEPATETANVQQAVPFFMVSDIEASLRFYVEGLGFKRTKQWIVDDKIRWCWLQLGGAAIMLQEFAPNSPLSIAKLGEGVSVCFQCKDALSIYRETLSRNLEPRPPLRRQQHVGYHPHRSGWIQTRLRKPHRCSGGDNLFERK